MNIGEDYSFICKIFSDTDITQRFNTIIKEISGALDLMEASDDISINVESIKVFLECYYTDIARLKDFSKIEKVNIAKIFAYTVYWFCRIHPLQIKNWDAKYHFINERVITHIYINKALNHMNIESETPYAYGRILETCDLLLYNLKYRIYTPQTLETLFTGLFNAATMKFKCDGILA